MKTEIKSDKNKLFLIFCSLVLLFVCFFYQGQIVFADNQDVKDGANVLSTKIQDEIKHINDEDMARVKGHPQIAVITSDDDSEDDIEQQAQDLFDKYKFGHAKYDNGVLLLVNIKTHHYYVMPGYGLEATLPDLWCNHLMTKSDEKLMTEKKYDKVVLTFVKRISERILEKKQLVKTKKEVEQHRKQEDRNSTFSLIVLVLLLVVIVGISVSSPFTDDDDGDDGGFGGFGGFGGGSSDSDSITGFGGSSGGAGGGGSW